MGIRKVEIHEQPEPRFGYNLPFPDVILIERILQGYNGQYSHFATDRDGLIVDDRFALDFGVPFGTPITPAKPGIVSIAFDNLSDFYEGVDFDEGIRYLPNLIVLRHKDNSLTLYSHLAQGSLRVVRGQRVVREVMAETGCSGWVGPEPHLHFAAFYYSIIPPAVRKSFPTIFRDYNHVLEDHLVT